MFVSREDLVSNRTLKRSGRVAGVALAVGCAFAAPAQAAPPNLGTAANQILIANINGVSTATPANVLTNGILPWTTIGGFAMASTPMA